MDIIGFIMGILLGIVNFGMGLIGFVFKLIVVAIVAGIARYKRRSVLLWIVITWIIPYAIIVLLFIPTKQVKLPVEIRTLDAFKGKHSVIASIMALCGMIAKLDGKVTKEEITTVREFIARTFNISKEELNEYAGAFEYGKNHQEQYQIFATVIRQSYANRVRVAQISYLLIGLGMSGDHFSNQIENYIKQVVAVLGLTEHEYQSIKYSFTGQQYGYQNGGYHTGGHHTAPSQDLTKKYSEILGVSEDASMNEIKKAYRKLVKEYHPDKMASESMPSDYVEFANKKIIEINEAYEYLKKIKE